MPQFAGPDTVTWAFLAVLLAVSGLLLFRTQRHFARQAHTPRSEDRPPNLSREPSEPAPTWMERWEVEMHQLARELSARLDSKMSALQHLTRDADRAAARLEAALKATGASARTNQAEGLLPGRTAPPAPDPGETASRSTARRLTPSRYDEIYLMADYGHPSSEIAARLGLPIGEVDLILSLRKGRRKHGE